MLNLSDFPLPEERRQFRQMILSHAEVFSTNSSEIGRTDRVDHSIDTGEHGPIRQRPSREPFFLRNKIKEMIADMEKQGLIQPSCSPWASPVVLIRKLDGSYRFWVDYRKLNAVTKKDSFPMPRIDDVLDCMNGAQFFSCLDQASGYWQVPVECSSKPKTAFVTSYGLYEFNVVPFGLCNAPATFQRLMQVILAGLEDFCSVCLDDDVVFSQTIEDHTQHLQEIFRRFEKAGLKLKGSKCRFLKPAVSYLGYVVSPTGLSTDQSKTDPIRRYPTRFCSSELRSFLGLASYYRRFVKDFAAIAQPLHALLRKDITFRWTTAQQDAFLLLKEKLVSAPVLSYPNFDQPFVVSTDARGRGLGAVLEQSIETATRPVAFASRTLTAAERNYSATELEGLAVVWALKRFRKYLLGHDVTVFTDHAALVHLFRNTTLSGRLAR